jgi:hypothetical protein
VVLAGSKEAPQRIGDITAARRFERIRVLFFHRAAFASSFGPFKYMNTVKVKREDLLTKMRANRAAHRDLFLKAQEGYRKPVIEELDRMLVDAKKGRPIQRSVTLTEPSTHIKDYDRGISMLEMSVEER